MKMPSYWQEKTVTCCEFFKTAAIRTSRVRPKNIEKVTLVMKQHLTVFKVLSIQRLDSNIELRSSFEKLRLEVEGGSTRHKMKNYSVKRHLISNVSLVDRR